MTIIEDCGGLWRIVESTQNWQTKYVHTKRLPGDQFQVHLKSQQFCKVPQRSACRWSGCSAWGVVQVASCVGILTWYTDIQVLLGMACVLLVLYLCYACVKQNVQVCLLRKKDLHLDTTISPTSQPENKSESLASVMNHDCLNLTAILQGKLGWKPAVTLCKLHHSAPDCVIPYKNHLKAHK